MSCFCRNCFCFLRSNLGFVNSHQMWHLHGKPIVTFDLINVVVSLEKKNFIFFICSLKNVTDDIFHLNLDTFQDLSFVLCFVFTRRLLMSLLFSNLQEEENTANAKTEPTHYSELDVKALKINNLRDELDVRGLSSKGIFHFQQMNDFFVSQFPFILTKV